MKIHSTVLFVTTAAFVSVLIADAAFGQAPAPASQILPSNSAPPEAPSFLKQAGQKIMESAQKKMLHNINGMMQGQPPPQTQTQPQFPPGATGDFASPFNSTNSTTNFAPPISSAKQLAPCRSWVNSQEKPIAVLLAIHGLGLQSKSYEFFGNEQSNRGIAVYAIDVRGFGAWIKANGKTKVNFDECLADIKTSLESIRAANPGLPVYLLGESMGGAIALRAASMYPELVDGLISSVPAGERFNQGKTSMKVFFNLLAGTNVANVGNDIVNQATKNAKLKSTWQDDPLSKLNLTPQELIQFQDFMNFNHEAARKLTSMPVLFVQGIGDQLVKPEGTWELFNSVAAKDKSFFAMPGEHLIFEEAQTQDPGPRDQNFRVISSWLATKVGRRNGRGGGGRGGAGSGAPFAQQVNIPGLDTLIQMVDNGQSSSAIPELERIRSQQPNNPKVLSILGKAYYLVGQFDKSSALFRSAMRLGRAGGDQSRAFNSYLLNTNREQFDRTAAGTSPSDTVAGNRYGGQLSKGKVYAFYANWADQCKGLQESLRQLTAVYGSKVDIMPVNIEDPSTDSLIEQFKVGPIPTLVFVAPNGKVNSTIIGECNQTNYEEAVKAIVRQ